MKRKTGLLTPTLDVPGNKIDAAGVLDIGLVTVGARAVVCEQGEVELWIWISVSNEGLERN